MNKFDKYKRIVEKLDKLYVSDEMVKAGNRFNVIITSNCNFISHNSILLLFTDTEDKQDNYNDILELCKFRWEDYIHELTKYKTT